MTKKILPMLMAGFILSSSLHASISPKDINELNKVRKEFKKIDLRIILNFMRDDFKPENINEMIYTKIAKVKGNEYILESVINTKSKIYKEIEKSYKDSNKKYSAKFLIEESISEKTKFLCSAAPSYAILEKGAVMKYDYFNEKNKFIGSNSISLKSCLNYKN
jgi:hypothetical protein